MIIVPKFGENIFLEKRENLDLIEDKIEIQLLDENIRNWNNYVNGYLSFKRLNEMTIHVPLSMVSLEVIYMNSELRSCFEQFISFLDVVTINQDIKFNILCHFSLKLKEMQLSGLYDWINYLFRRTSNNNIKLVFENSVVILGYLNGSLLMDVINSFNEKRVSFCFDICHYLILRNLFGNKLNFPRELFKRCSQVHFSYTKDDGLKDNHGIVHPDIESCKKDLLLLKDLNIDFKNTLIVAEINEKDYYNRPDLIKEMEYLKCLSSDNQLLEV